MTAPILSIRSADAIQRAAQHITAGKLVIIPTDTIYGIAVLPFKKKAIARLYEVRNRSPEPAHPFLLTDSHFIHSLTRPNPVALRLAQRFWPGSLTLILPPAADLPAMLRTAPIALRVPNFPTLHPLLHAVGGYVFASGAIFSGYSPAITAKEALHFFGENVALILDGGRAPFGVPSTIVDCIASPPAILRRGAIPEEKIWETLEMDCPGPVPTKTGATDETKG